MYLARLLGQIGKMGSNLNQVAKWANADRKFSEADLRLIWGENFLRVMRQVQAVQEAPEKTSRRSG